MRVEAGHRRVVPLEGGDRHRRRGDLRERARRRMPSRALHDAREREISLAHHASPRRGALIKNDRPSPPPPPSSLPWPATRLTWSECFELIDEPRTADESEMLDGCGFISDAMLFQLIEQTGKACGALGALRTIIKEE